MQRLGLPQYNWWNEALHGLARAGIATQYPQVIGLSSSFNASLWHKIGRAIGMEARGRNNGLDGELYHGLTLWAPNVNIFRDPRWGRGQETAGEDPMLSGVWAVNFVRGVQGAAESHHDEKRRPRRSSPPLLSNTLWRTIARRMAARPSGCRVSPMSMSATCRIPIWRPFVMG